MSRASPVEIRKAMVVAETYAKAGIDFIPMPVLDGAHKNELIQQADNALEDLIKMTEGDS